MTREDAIAFMEGYPALGGTGQLDILRLLLKRMGDPHLAYPCIHVAGTNGKGSVCAYLNEILLRNGQKVGLFTSPYLVDFAERIQINSLPIEDKLLIESVEIVKYETQKLARETDAAISQFGFITLVMFLAFAKSKVSIAILETGLGGAFDPTNVCVPTLTVITAIGMDHTRYLGNTLEEIAANKAGIIKENVPVICAPAQDTVSRIFQNRAEAVKAPFFQVNFQDPVLQKSDITGIAFSFKGEKYTLQMRGEYQAVNAALAIASAEVLRKNGWKIENIPEALQKCKWAGRLELICDRPIVILDGAHNVQGAESVAAWVKSALQGKKIILVAASAKDKDVKNIARIFGGIAKQVITTTFPNARSMDAQKLAEVFFETQTHVFAESDCMKALGKALEAAADDDAILVCGSLYLIGEIKKRMGELKGSLCLKS